VPRIFRVVFGIVSIAAHSLQGRRTRPYHILPKQALSDEAFQQQRHSFCAWIRDALQVCCR
jgi:hypothetical protein